MHRLLLALPVAAMLATPTGADAAPRVAYQCGHDLCLADAQLRNVRHVVRGTRAKPVSEVLNVRDSGRIAYIRDDRTRIVTTGLKTVRTLKGRTALSTDAQRYVFAIDAGFICIGASLTDTQPKCIPATVAYAQWWKHRQFYGEVPNPTVADKQESVCAMSVTDQGFTCDRVVARAQVGGSFREFDVSPRGDRLVVTEYAQHDGSRTRLAVYDTRSGKRLRTLTGSSRGIQPEDRTPSFSPDGRTVVFRRGEQQGLQTLEGYEGRVCLIPATGGTPSCRGRGLYPVWVR